MSAVSINMPAQHLPQIYLYRRIVLAKIFIDEHYADSIDLNDIAGEASFSKFHFIRLFKKAYGKTPHQYLIWVRIENAKLFLQKNISVAEACYSVGFDAISSFTHLFKKITNVTPSVYRQIQKLRKVEINNYPLKFIPDCFARQNGWR